MEQYNKLRGQYPCFYYRGYETEETPEQLKITYHFEIEGLSSFAPTWIFPKPESWKGVISPRLLFSLGMVELISYWKITCSPRVIVEAGSLNADQISWWKNLYFNGLGEFFYVNNIREADPENFMELTAIESTETDVQTNREPERKLSQGILIPIGGGKDSVVSLELLRQTGYPLYGYIINPRGATLNSAEAAGVDELHLMKVRRTLDSNMLELNRQGFLNGHTPFSALVAFSTLIAARLLGLSYIALSNESSANESTVQGSTVNHQYSKSFQFERDFHEYCQAYLPEEAYYFSLLRPLSEFQIARYFAKQKKYHRIFRSCNAGSKTDSWCGHCPKCLFVYLILSPFLEEEEVQAIFGRNMLEDAAMVTTLEQLIGVAEEKPFECVGSRDEINTAVTMTVSRMKEQGKTLPLLLKKYEESGFYHRCCTVDDPYGAYYDQENLLPEPLAQLVKKNCVAGYEKA